MSDDDPMLSSDEWCSPRMVTEPLKDFFGGAPDCDPCSNVRSIVGAPMAYTFGGLYLPWGDRSYMNNPYSTNDPWAAKAVYEMKIGNVSELVTLMMVATSTAWWARMMNAKRNPRLLFTHRIKFIGDASSPNCGARFDTVLKYFGPRVRLFDRTFKHLERWSSWGR